MKILTSKTFTILLFSLPVLFISCKKEASTVSNLPITSEQISSADAPGLYKTTSGNYKLVLQPDSVKGQDAWIEYSPSDASYATHNSGSADQIKIMSWTDGGVVINARSLINFTDISQVPASSTVQQATLYLYGIAQGSLTLPQGNSYYPGSPYNSYGTNDAYVQRITGNWNESTVTWNSKPPSTVTGEGLIPPSTKQFDTYSYADVTQIVRKLTQQDPSKDYGFMLQLTNENIYRSLGFYSSEYSDAAKRPKLIIVYSN